jgi:hypothetical protein
MQHLLLTSAYPYLDSYTQRLGTAEYAAVEVKESHDAKDENNFREPRLVSFAEKRRKRDVFSLELEICNVNYPPILSKCGPFTMIKTELSESPINLRKL